MISIDKHSRKIEKLYLNSIKEKMKKRKKYDISKYKSFDYLKKEIDNYKNAKYNISDDFIEAFRLFIIELEENLDSILVDLLPDALRKYKRIVDNNNILFTFLKVDNNKIIFESIIKKIFDYDFFISENKDLSYAIADDFKAKVCPYCNQEGTYTLNDDNLKEMRPAFDHFLAKSNYPIFSISLYNLVPVCYNCNSKKDNIDFSIDENLYPFIEGVEKEIIFSYKRIDVDKFEVSINSKNERFLNNCETLLLKKRYNKMCSDRIISKEKVARTYTNDYLVKIKELDKDISKIKLLDVLEYQDNVKIIRNNPYKKFDNDIAMQIYHDINEKCN